MKIYTILPIILIVTLTGSCFPDKNKKTDENKENPSGSSFNLVSDGKTIKSKLAFYINSGENIELTSVSDNNTILTISLKTNAANNYKFNKNALLSYNTTDQLYHSKSGELNFIISSDSLISGSFDIQAIIDTDTLKTVNFSGSFTNIKPNKTQLESKTTFESRKNMYIFFETSDIKISETKVEITYESTSISFNYKDKKEMSFSTKIQRVEANSMGVIFYANDSKIDKITIDILNENQTTIWYKNEDTLTFFI